MAECNSKKDKGVLGRIFQLMEHRKVTDKMLEEEIGIGRGTVSHWRNDGRNSYLHYINAICDCLDTTPNYLFRGVENHNEEIVLTPIEKDMINMYRTINDEKQKYINEGLRLFTQDL